MNKNVKEAFNWLLDEFKQMEQFYDKEEQKKFLGKIDIIRNALLVFDKIEERIKTNKEIIKENKDLNSKICHDLEIENTALEFFLMLLERE